jgi:lipopolysaccharide export system protein LptA
MRISERGLAEIKYRLHRLKGFRILVCLTILLLAIPSLFSQKKQANQPKKSAGKVIELVFAEVDIQEKDKEGRDMHRFIGDVRLRHKDVLMSCDSAHYWQDVNQVIAFSKIHIEQGDTLDLFGDNLFYDGKTEKAIVKKNVELIDKETHLYTEAIDYDVKNKIARYDDHGRITNAENTLTSIHGVYYVSQDLFHFKDSVKIVNPDYVMTADTMDYNTKTETSFFTGPSELKGDSIYLYCEKGWYDTKNEITSIWKNSLIDNKKQIVRGDSLYFNDNTGYGEAYRNVVIQDTVNDIAIEGNFAWYYKQPEKFLVTKEAVFIQISGVDSLFLHADTITAVTIADTSAAGYRLMRAYHGCRIFSKDMQAKCDSLSYSFQDSVIRFYQKPVLWTEENQLTADSIAIFTKNRQADRLELYNTAFVVIQVDSLRFNQIKGRNLTGYFKDNELRNITIEGNCESIYFLVEGDGIAGVNHSKCAKIEATVENGKISEITDSGSPDGFIDPPETKKPKDLRLENFQWFDAIRPKKKSDIFRN